MRSLYCVTGGEQIKQKNSKKHKCTGVPELFAAKWGNPLACKAVAAVDLPHMGELAQQLVRLLLPHLIRGSGARLYLSGELGTGKTTLCQFVVNKLIGLEQVPSPSYSLVNPYSLHSLYPQAWLYHVDCYRLASAAELYALGVDDLDARSNLLLVEWPERALAALPVADLLLELVMAPSREQRIIKLSAFSQHGKLLVDGLTGF